MEISRRIEIRIELQSNLFFRYILSSLKYLCGLNVKICERMY